MFRAMHDLPTEGWTFGMHTFYTQVTDCAFVEYILGLFQGGVNFYKDGRVEKGDAVKVYCPGSLLLLVDER